MTDRQSPASWKRAFTWATLLVLAAVAMAAAVACDDSGFADEPTAFVALATVVPATPFVKPLATITDRLLQSGEYDRLFNIEVSTSHLPKLGEPFTVTARFTPIARDEEDAEVWIEINGAAYIDGEDRWHGPLKFGEEKVLVASFAILTEGNHEISGLGHSNWAKDRNPLGFERNSPLLVAYVSAETSKWGIEFGHAGTGFAKNMSDGDVSAGRTLVTDTALLLNTSSAERIEFIDSADDVVRLQQEGLFPAEFRYQWRYLNTWNFSDVFFMAVFGGSKASSGHLIALDDRFFTVREGALAANITERSVAPALSVQGRLVSPVVVQMLGWDVVPLGAPAAPDDRVFRRGETTFAFTLDGNPFFAQQVPLKPGPPPTPRPVITAEPILAYNFVGLYQVETSPRTIRPGDTFDVELRVILSGVEQEISAASIGLTFNPAHLEALGVKLDTASPLTLNALDAAPAVNNDSGLVFISASVAEARLAAKSGFSLATVTFRVRDIEVNGELDTEIQGALDGSEHISTITSINPKPDGIAPIFSGVAGLRITILES